MLQRHDYAAAERLGEYTLRVQPGAAAYLQTYANAAFAAGDFSRAAGAYLQIYAAIEDARDWPPRLRAAADAFAAAGDSRRGVAALEAQRAREKQKDRVRDAALQAEIAGLRLFAGDEKEAKRYADAIRGGRWAEFSADSLHRVAWWYYRAGRSAEAVDLMNRLVGTTQNASEAVLALAWAEIDSGRGTTAADRFSRGLQSVPAAASMRPRADSAQIGLALALWGPGQRERALSLFWQVTQQSPEWMNVAWVRALYPPHTAAIAADIKAERDRREAAQKAMAQQRH
jgi:tetratricopeptide (TPR) repeat protein